MVHGAHFSSGPHMVCCTREGTHTPWHHAGHDTACLIDAQAGWRCSASKVHLYHSREYGPKWFAASMAQVSVQGRHLQLINEPTATCRTAHARRSVFGHLAWHTSLLNKSREGRSRAMHDSRLGHLA